MKSFRHIPLFVTFIFTMCCTIKAISQTEEVFYTPKLIQTNLNDAKSVLERYLKLMVFPNNEKSHWNAPEKVSVYDDRFELTFKSPQYPITFYFNDLPNYKIEVIRIHNQNDSWTFEIRLGKLILNVFKDKDKGWEIADYLYFFQKQSHSKPYVEQLANFVSIAAEYRALKIKPVVTE